MIKKEEEKEDSKSLITVTENKKPKFIYKVIEDDPYLSLYSEQIQKR